MKIEIKTDRVIVEYEDEYIKIGELHVVSNDLIYEDDNIGSFEITIEEKHLFPTSPVAIELIDCVTEKSYSLPNEKFILEYYSKVDWEEYVLDRYYKGLL